MIKLWNACSVEVQWTWDINAAFKDDKKVFLSPSESVVCCRVPVYYSKPTYSGTVLVHVRNITKMQQVWVINTWEHVNYHHHTPPSGGPNQCAAHTHWNINAADAFIMFICKVFSSARAWDSSICLMHGCKC